MKHSLCLAALVLLLAGCHRNPHFITDKDYRNEVHADFQNRCAELGLDDLQLDTLSNKEREAMEFLYAYMPLCDVADYEPSFYLQQVRYAFKAREEMPWGKDIPEDVFRHFVLVYRVNNENLDTARMVFFHELKDRVKGMSMEEAALEVNHWCHEHVAYRAADARTSAPLATMRTSLGRCGEESTFAVTALRAVGIPARQCYTPRWAHCDDNHAWVEVWTAEEGEPQGKWKYLGACEPSPRLDMGWFSVPATRCLMVHTKAFGKYKGDEEVVRRTNMYSELNLLSHYAPTRRLTVRTLTGNGDPMDSVTVMFKMYNYAEYYTLATYLTDENGEASITTGLGDIMVWVTNGCRHDEMIVDVRKDSVVEFHLCGTQGALPTDYEYEIVPPAPGEPKVVATEAETATNAKRLAYEDSLRNAYTATFPTKENYKSLLPDNWVWNPRCFSDDQVWEIIHKSEGNYAEIYKFFAYWGGQYRSGEHIYDYLKSYSDKDLRDITADVLESHVTGFDWLDRIKGTCTNHTYTYDVYKRGIMPARISNELVRPYRKELACFKGMTAEEIKQWVVDSVVVDDSGNYYNCPVSPVGVYKLRRADRHSRDIFFVAACRAAEVPAYLDNATNTLYTWDDKGWHINSFTENTDSDGAVATASLTLTYRGKEPAKPVYWPHFTIAKLENGNLRTFDFEDDPRMASFPATIDLEPGIYCLSTGNRYPDGAVRSRMEYFELKPGEKATKEIIILPLLARTGEQGSVDKNLELFDGIELWDYAGKTGMLYVNLGNYGEPSKHLVAELKAMQKELRQWGGMTLIVGPEGIGMPSWNLVNTDFANAKGKLEMSILEALKTDKAEYPLVALINSDGQILYHSEGYKIGTVDQMLKVININK